MRSSFSHAVCLVMLLIAQACLAGTYHDAGNYHVYNVTQNIHCGSGTDVVGTLARTFTVDVNVTSASLTLVAKRRCCSEITGGVGLPHKLSLNGTVLDTYDRGDCVVRGGTYNVTSLLHAGTNTITITSPSQGTVPNELWVDDITVTWSGPPINHPPFIVNPGSQIAHVNVPYTLSIIAGDPDGDALTITSSGLPAWLPFDNRNGTVTLVGTPRAQDAGTVSITITASDGAATASATFTIAVEYYCWPNLVSSADFSGVPYAASVGTRVPFELTFSSSSARDVTLGRYPSGCWALDPLVYHLPSAGCTTFPATLTRRAASNCNGLVTLRFRTPGLERALEHTIVADHPELADASPFGSLQDLLEAYAPLLIMHRGELFAPTDAAITVGSAELRPWLQSLPSFDPTIPVSADLLRTYSWNGLELDLPGSWRDIVGAIDDYRQRMQGFAGNPHVVYATAFEDHDHQAVFVQYWFNYHINAFAGGDVCLGYHEGDWEHVTLWLTRNGNGELASEPYAVFFAGHDAGEGMWWSEVSAEGTHVKVYVGLGSHASYAQSGLHPVNVLWGTLCEDDETEDGTVYCPQALSTMGTAYRLEVLPRWDDLRGGGTDLAWAEFAGFWGRQADATTPVPRGPHFHPEWAEPYGEFDGLECVAASPVDLVVYAPNGQATGPESADIPGSSYEVREWTDARGTSHRSGRVRVPGPEAGRYAIEVMPLPGASPEDIFSVEATLLRLGKPITRIVVADSLPVSAAQGRFGVTVPSALARTVPLDIRPESCPNPLNPASRGVLPVAVLGTAAQDVALIDPASLRLEGIPPRQSGLEDVGSATGSSLACQCAASGPDGREDLTAKFAIGDLVQALGPLVPGSMRTLTLIGALRDGTPLEGHDCVIVVGRQGHASVGFAPTLRLDILQGVGAGTQRVAYIVPAAGRVRLAVYDVAGRCVKQLVNEERAAGRHVVEWSTVGVSSGVYFYRMEARGVIRADRFLVLR